MSERFIIHNARVVLPDGILEGGSVSVVDGRIVDVASHDLSAPRRHDSDGWSIIDAEGQYLAPGFVELHIHGCDDLGFETEAPDTLLRIRDFLVERGVTTFVPTLQCDLGALSRLADSLAGDESLRSRVPGFYVEGPFVSEAKKGGILEETLRAPDLEYLEEVLEAARGRLLLMTVAPELEGIDAVVERLTERGVVPCWGHSNATVDQVRKLPGVRCNITHLFNGMSEISHKRNGLAMLPFLDTDLFCEVNGDGVHLNGDAIRLCHRHLDPDRVILISDAVVSAGRAHGEYRYFGRKVVSGPDGVRYENGTLIGSNCLMPEIVRRYIETTGSEVYEAVRLATLNPCRLLGIDDRRGSIEVGKDADLVIFDDRIEASRVLLSEGVPLFE